MLSQISFNVISDTSFSKLSYMFTRVLIRVENKFMLYFFIALILAFFITFIYYRYVSRLLRIEEMKVLNMLKKVFRPILAVFRRKEKKKKRLTEHDIFIKRQEKKKGEREKTLDLFGSTEVKKEEPFKKEEKFPETYSEDGYVMWPPKSKEEQEKEKTFDELSKIK